MLEMRFLGPILGKLGLHASMATFLSNAISVFLTSFATMPIFIRSFGWWLFPKEDLPSINAKGCTVLAVLFVAEVLLLWNLLPW
jgi:antibiotic biosynthesis monooxygenase (ABM) superfamily enzyme